MYFAVLCSGWTDNYNWAKTGHEICNSSLAECFVEMSVDDFG